MVPLKRLKVFKTEIKRHSSKCQRRVAFFVDFLMLRGIPFELISVNANCTNRNFVMYGHYFHHIVRRKITVMTWWLSMSHSSVSVYYAFLALQNCHFPVIQISTITFAIFFSDIQKVTFGGLFQWFLYIDKKITTVSWPG